MYIYLFEAKSIQSYLFQSGKLIDVISASERLDRLIDSSESSVLHHVLTSAKLNSDLLDENLPNHCKLIRFMRCKGGAFYCYAQKKQPLLDLRSAWTLTLQQLFPSMEYTDALVEADQLADALDKAHSQLAADRNVPSLKLPLASAPCRAFSRTGQASVSITAQARQATTSDEDIDIDTDLHRQAYQTLKMRNAAALQDKFTPGKLKGTLFYPIDLENDFQFEHNNEQLNRSQSEAIKDIALIHIDGNGLGILLMALKSALQGSNDDDFRKAFRQFSEALNQATTEAAQQATQFVYDCAKYLNYNDPKQPRLMVPIRPIVLGGDDITLLCRADLALEYSQIFCSEFKVASQKALEPLFNNYLRQGSSATEKPNHILDHLTASGGIVYHKAGHPFTHSHHLVEALCNHAKRLTKSVNENERQVGPATLAFHRLSNAVHDDFNDIVENSLTFTLRKKESMQIGQSAYFVDDQTSRQAPFSFDKLAQLVELSCQTDAPVSIARWRQMATCIAQGDITEADRIYHRGCSLANPKEVEKLNLLLASLTPDGCEQTNWYWHNKQKSDHKKYYSIINDLLITHHFQSYANAEITQHKEELNHG
ncbi:hypothetical protein H5200_02515 [Pseudoalteromonas sp. SG43-7]|uniref:Cas10/Cmr2 second palm domain-containing protein n=1 Tax=Pseudoalteromonas sp. SG43-7 TaxID=2760966 RepID=UPI0015FFB678|nr:hypothetical protein [Pseudoalteromonas sp. SG43-7]MBB1420791.1 hypothetical protein [Pseudoalteromonas sp. SG43-7]